VPGTKSGLQMHPIILTTDAKRIMMPLIVPVRRQSAFLMRTTLTLDDDLAETLARMARREDRSFKDVVNETLRRGLLTGERPAETGRPAFAVQPEACGFLPGVDPLRLNQLVDQIELDRFVVGQVQDHTKR
jgi:hypothetical protein